MSIETSSERQLLSIGNVHRVQECLRFDNIVAKVCARFSITDEEFRSHRKFRSLSHARHLAFYICRKMTNLSYPDIGKAAGFDHTSVIYGVRHVQDAIGWGDESTERLANAIMDELRAEKVVAS